MAVKTNVTATTIPKQRNNIFERKLPFRPSSRGPEPILLPSVRLPYNAWILIVIIVSGKLTDNGGEQNVPSFTLCLHLLFLLIHVSVGAVENILHALIGLGIIGHIADGRGKLLPGV